MFETVLFDLDGTLTDPFEGITNSVAYALQKFGIKVDDKGDLKKFIGPPLYKSFESFYGFSHADALKAVGFYREYYADNGIFENKLYAGTDEVLKELQSYGKQILLATSKPEVFAKRILDHFEISKYFDFVAGATLGTGRTEKAEVIAYALQSANVDKTKAVMVGDRKHDVEGAKAFGIPTIGVLFGYGSESELSAAGATYLARSPRDILTILR